MADRPAPLGTSRAAAPRLPGYARRATGSPARDLSDYSLRSLLYVLICYLCARTKRAHTPHYEPICSICEPPRQTQLPPTRHATSDVPLCGAPQRTKWTRRPNCGGENTCCSYCNRQPGRPAHGNEARESAGRLVSTSCSRHLARPCRWRPLLAPQPLPVPASSSPQRCGRRPGRGPAW